MTVVKSLINSQIGNHNGGKHLEKSFYPEMNYPPAPILSNTQGRVIGVHQSHGIKQGNGDGTIQEKMIKSGGAFFSL